jgi:hypothetical protein
MGWIYALRIRSFNSIPANGKRESGYMHSGMMPRWLGLNFIVWLSFWLVDLISLFKVQSRL